MRKSSTSIFAQLDKKAEAEELRRLTGRVDLCVSLEHIKEVEQKIMPKVENFRAELKTFYDENQQHRNILLRFDEVMLEKASKFAIEQVYNHFNK